MVYQLRDFNVLLTRYSYYLAASSSEVRVGPHDSTVAQLRVARLETRSKNKSVEEHEHLLGRRVGGWLTVKGRGSRPSRLRVDEEALDVEVGEARVVQFLRDALRLPADEA